MDLQFGQYRLKHAERLLLGPEGAVELSARSFDILAMLLGKSDQVIGKNELLDVVWPGLVVEENTLQVHISALRKALPAGMIMTVHGRGYKYSGPQPVADTSPSVRSSAIASDRKPVVVVLPFENLSADPNQQFFSDGITADITDRLARFRVFAVIGQHSASALRAAVPDFAAIRERLKAEFVVTGSLRRADERIRIAVRLSDAASEGAIWAERYDRPASDLFGLQDEISELVAAAIARHLEVEINVRSSSRPHASLSSYEYLQQGYWHFKKLTHNSTIAARHCFERAIALDPRNAEALGWLGCTYCEDWILDFSLPESAARGVELTAQAVALDPANGLILTGHAWALLRVGELDGALRASELSIALNPSDPHILVNHALALGYDGRAAEAADFLRHAQRLEPIPPLWFGEFSGIIAFADGRYEETLAGVEPIAESGWDIMYALACHGLMGEASKARATLARLAAVDRKPNWTLGVSREPYRMAAVRERLSDGIRKALSF
jgi:TolB-like protein